MILGIIIAAIEIIIIPFSFLGYFSTILAFFNVFIMLLCLAASIVDLVVCIKRIVRMHGSQKGRAIAGVVISGNTLIIALAFIIGFLGGFFGLYPIV